jgi:tape measure domain-containing protein
MATNRDVKLTLGVETTGAEEIDKLKLAVEKLAKEGGDAAPEFQQLADEIDRLGQQAAALRTFEELARATDELKVSQQAAKTTTEELGAQLVTLGNVTERAKREQDGAAQNAREAQASYKALKDELQILRSTYDANGDRAANYKAKVEELTRAKIAAKNAFDTANQSLRETNAAVRDAEQAEAKLQTRYAQSERSLNSVNTALRERSTALDGARTAADQLGVATDNVAAAQVALVTSLNQVGTAADQVRLKKIAETRALEQSVVALKAAQDAADATAKASADAARALQSAFGTIGTRSAQELEAEIRQVRAAMDAVRTGAGLTGNELAAAMASGNARVAELERGLREVRGELTMADKAAGLFKNSMGQIAAGNLIADGIGALVEKVKDLGRQFITTIVETEQLRRGLMAVYKDTATAGAQFEFLRKTAQDSGQAVGTLGASFLRFSAATQSANIPLSVTNDLFATVTRVAGSLGLSAEATGGTLDALGQIASKGVVSLEELRQQLGDRLPGALSAAAKGLGLTDAELIKLVESGNLAARDFFPAFSQGLKTLQGETEGLVPTWNRLKNAFTTTAQSLGDAGFLDLLIGALRGLAVAVGAVLVPITSLIDTSLTFVRTLGVLAGAITTLTNPVQALRDLWEEFGVRQKAVAKSFVDVVAGADSASAATANLTNVTKAAKDAVAANGVQWDTLSRSQQAAAISAQIASDKQLTLGGQLASTNANLLALIDSQTKESESLAKVAKATQEQGATLVALTALRGNEQATLIASTQAAENYSSVLEKVRASKAEETRLLQLQLATLIRVREVEVREGRLKQEELDKETLALRNKIEASKAEAEQADASAEAARREILVRQLASESYRDNSDRIVEYREALAAAQRTLEATIEGQKRGVLSAKDVQDAQDAVTAAQNRYNDSLSDATARQQAYADSQKIVFQQAEVGLRLALATEQAAERKARLDGNEFAVRQSQIKQREIELQLYKLKIAAMEAEANGAIQVANATLQEKIAKGEVSAVDQIRIANSIRLAEIKLQEAKILGTNIEAMEKELQALKNGTSAREESTRSIGTNTSARIANTNAVSANSDAMDELMMKYKLSADYSERQIALLERETAAAERAAEAKRKANNVDKDGFTTDSNGQRMTQFVWNRSAIIDYLKQAGLEETLAEELAKQFVNGDGTVGYEATQAQMKWGGKYSTLSEALGKMVDFYKYDDAGKSEADNILRTRGKSATELVREKERGQTVPPGGGSMGGGSQTGGSGRSGNGNSSSGVSMQSGMTINVNIGGRSTPIGVRSQADADQLAGIFRTLEDASRRSS